MKRIFMFVVLILISVNAYTQDQTFQPGEYWVNIEEDGSVSSVNSAAVYTPGPNQYNNFKIVKVFIATEQEYYDFVNTYLENLVVDLAVVVDGNIENIPQVQAFRKNKIDTKGILGKGEMIDVQAVQDITAPVTDLVVSE